MSLKVFIIAGEPSGDALGGALMKALKQKSGAGDITFTGIGGVEMAAQGLKSLLPMEELCVMGLWEVLGQLPRLASLISAITRKIEQEQPDIVVTVDLPDFNFRLASGLKKRGISKARLVHYVAPTVWAWRPGRAKKIAQFLDGLLCLFPFEPPYFEKHGLRASFVGHPLVESGILEGDGARFREKYDISQNAPVMGVFFGSREGELARLAPTLIETLLVFKEQVPDIELIIPTLPNLGFEITNLMSAVDIPSYLITAREQKWDAFQACDLAVAVSGTVGLELAYAKIPHIIAYKMHPASWPIAKAMVKGKYAHLANILLDAPVIPEFLQGRCTVYNLAKELLKLHKFEESRKAQISKTQILREKLIPASGRSPSEEAAEFVLSFAQGS